MIKELYHRIIHKKFPGIIIWYFVLYVVYPLRYFLSIFLIKLKGLFSICFGFRKDYVNNIKALKDLHLNEQCIIVGNGPSLRVEDLEFFKRNNVFTFGCNGIYHLFGKTNWRPDVYCISDPAFYSSTNGILPSILKQERIPFVFAIKSKRKTFNTSQFYEFEMALSPLYSTLMEPLSERIQYCISDLGTVVSACFQIANYMGFKKIYFYGVDNSYPFYFGSDGKFHIDRGIRDHAEGIIQDNGTDVDTIPSTKYEAFIGRGVYDDLRKFEKGFRKIKKYSEKNGILIQNLTRGGKLEVFSRKQIDDFISEFPVENK